MYKLKAPWYEHEITDKTRIELLHQKYYELLVRQYNDGNKTFYLYEKYKCNSSFKTVNNVLIEFNDFIKKNGYKIYSFKLSLVNFKNFGYDIKFEQISFKIVKCDYKESYISNIYDVLCGYSEYLDLKEIFKDKYKEIYENINVLLLNYDTSNSPIAYDGCEIGKIGDIDFLNFFVEKKIIDWDTVLIEACKLSNLEIVKYACFNIKKDHNNIRRREFLCGVFYSESQDIIEYLFEEFPDSPLYIEYLLECCCAVENKIAINFLIKKQIDVLQRNNH